MLSDDELANEGESSDPALTLNLLRQKNEAEIRCGSAKLNDRRAFYFSESLTNLTPDRLSESYTNMIGSSYDPINQVNTAV